MTIWTDDLVRIIGASAIVISMLFMVLFFALHALYWVNLAADKLQAALTEGRARRERVKLAAVRRRQEAEEIKRAVEGYDDHAYANVKDSTTQR